MGRSSDVPAQLGPKAAALAWLEAAPALWRDGPSQSHNSQLGPGLAWPKLRLLEEKVHILPLDTVINGPMTQNNEPIFSIFL